MPERRRRRSKTERRLRLMYGTAWRADRGQFLKCLAAVIGWVTANLLYPLGLAAMVSGAITHHPRRLVIGVVIGSIAMSGYYVLQGAISSLQMKLTDETTMALDQYIGGLINSAPFLEHFERPEYQAEIDTLRQRRRSIAAMPTQSMNMLGSGLLIAGVAAVLGLLWPPLAVVPLFAVGTAMANRRAALIEKRSDEELAEPRRLLGELFSLVSTADPSKELRTYGVVNDLLDRHARLGEQVEREELRAVRRGAALKAGGWFIYGLAFVGAIAILLVRAVHGETSPGAVVAAMGLMRRAQRYVTRVSSSAGSFASAMTTADRVLWLEDYVGTVLASGTEDAPARLRQGIRLENVDFKYPGQEELTLKDVSLTLPAGSIVALVGENGAGKSTLVKLLTGMYQPTDGRITVDGADLTVIKPDRWRAATTGAFQDFVRFQTTLGEGVGVGDLPRSDDEDALHTALSRAGAAAVLDELPDGLDTLLGRFVRGRSLSTGQWQRVALARGLMRQTPVLVVLDEPTASLDPPAEAALYSSYQAAARQLGRANGTITVLVTHRFSSVHMADQIIVMNNGHVSEEGDHTQLIERNGLYAELFALQAERYLGKTAY
jgi:ATP-binding cassette, subfamily B, bacterial